MKSVICRRPNLLLRPISEIRTEILEPQILRTKKEREIRSLINKIQTELGDIIKIVPMLREVGETAARMLFRGLTAYLQKEQEEAPITLDIRQRTFLERKYLDILNDIKKLKSLVRGAEHTKIRHNLGVIEDYIKETIGAALGFMIY
jgi:hypothetical protein